MGSFTVSENPVIETTLDPTRQPRGSALERMLRPLVTAYPVFLRNASHRMANNRLFAFRSLALENKDMFLVA